MRKNIKTLLCVTALVGAMSSGIAFADDLNIDGYSQEGAMGTYDNVNVDTSGDWHLPVQHGQVNITNKLTNNGTITNIADIITNEIDNQSIITRNVNFGSLTINNGGNNSGTIDQRAIYVNGGTLTNNGTIEAGTFNNSGQLTGTGKLS